MCNIQPSVSSSTFWTVFCSDFGLYLYCHSVIFSFCFVVYDSWQNSVRVDEWNHLTKNFIQGINQHDILMFEFGYKRKQISSRFQETVKVFQNSWRSNFPLTVYVSLALLCWNDHHQYWWKSRNPWIWSQVWRWDLFYWNNFLLVWDRDTQTLSYFLTLIR